ncbi:MAG: tripartite tricarboxylate transporter substrate-binding protein, partial [Beijerinckiaceae bacterium]|nr:tripartite tricarboxylate transporter substrate-binding protein [Beijerinckiaceae bacterium]
MSNSASLARLLTTASVLIGCSLSTKAQEADFFTGKTLSLLVGVPPGGGYDAYTRLLARHMGRHVPGSPQVVVRNMPGAGGLVAANHLYNLATKDGTTLGLFASSVLFSPKLGEKRAQFDTGKFTWIGNIDQTIGTCVVSSTSSIQSFDELLSKSAIFGAESPSAVNSIHPRGFNALFGARIQIINGYPGSTQVLLAMSRGEVQGGCGFALSSLKSARRYDWEQGNIKAIIQTGFEKSEELKGVPHIYDYAKTEEDKKVMHVIYGTHALGRPLVAPPDLPSERVKSLRDAFNGTMKDPAFLAESDKSQMPIDPSTGEEVEKIVEMFSSYPSDIYDRAKKILEAGEVVNVQLKEMHGTIQSIARNSLSVSDSSGKVIKLTVSS